MTIRILIGDVRERLRELPDESVHCVVTSPPYWGLRDYGTAEWEGGDAECDHRREDKAGSASSTLDGGKGNVNHAHEAHYRDVCGKCGARRVDSQLGLEPTPEEHARRMVEVFREVRRVMRADGTCWVNYGDCYANTNGIKSSTAACGTDAGPRGGRYNRQPCVGVPAGLKPKDLVGMPWRIAFALQADGWYLRSDIIWAKPNPMPESVTDRPTKSHEYVFLLSKAARYYYDADAVREAGSPNTHSRGKAGQPIESNEISYKTASPGIGVKNNSDFSRYLADRPVGSPRNLRDVWTIPTAPFPGAHFATFPPKLVEPCIKAGTSEHGCCAECGAPWEREVEREVSGRRDSGGSDGFIDLGMNAGRAGESATNTIGWYPTCSCDAAVIPCTVLDPFGGAGTVGLVADRLGRDAVLIELNPEYAEMAERRIKGDCPMFAAVEVS